MKKLSILIPFIVFSALVFAQSADGGLVNSGANIVIESGTYLVIDGDSKADYIVSGNGEIELDGTISLEGDWINNNAASDGFTGEDGTGTVQFTGAQDNMVIGGTQSTNFESVTIDRASQNIDVDINTSIEGTLTLTNGILTATGTDSIRLKNTATGAIAGGSDGSFVNGNLVRAVTTSTAYDFHVGEGEATTNYHRTTVTTNGTFAGVAEIVTTVDEATRAGNNTDVNLYDDGITQDGTPINAVPSNGGGDYVEWVISPVSGSVSGGSYGVNLYLNDITADLVDNKFTVMKRATGSTDFGDYDTFDGSTTIPSAGAAGRTTASGYAKKDGFTSFSKFIVGKGINELPVELVSFDGGCENNSTQINWVTASEKDNDYFVIETSEDGFNFTEVATIYPESHNSNTLLEYNENVATGSGYYRLNQVDLDGSNTFHDVVYVQGCQSIENTITAYSSNNENIIININNKTNMQEFNINVMDISGKLLFSNVEGVQNGQNTIIIPRENMATGLYMVNVFNEQETHAQKLYLK